MLKNNPTPSYKATNKTEKTTLRPIGLPYPGSKKRSQRKMTANWLPPNQTAKRDGI